MANLTDDPSEEAAALMVAVELLQAIVVANRLTDDRTIAVQYETAARQYDAAGGHKTAVILRLLASRLMDQDRLAQKQLLRTPTAGEA
jgi:hypothetical protein